MIFEGPLPIQELQAELKKQGREDSFSALYDFVREKQRKAVEQLNMVIMATGEYQRARNTSTEDIEDLMKEE